MVLSMTYRKFRFDSYFFINISYSICWIYNPFYFFNWIKYRKREKMK